MTITFPSGKWFILESDPSVSQAVKLRRPTRQDSKQTYEGVRRNKDQPNEWTTDCFEKPTAASWPALSRQCNCIGCKQHEIVSMLRSLAAASLEKLGQL
jgi:hypothetical protein